MARKLTYIELEQMVNEIEKDFLEYKRANEDALKAIEELALIFNAVPGHIAVIDSQYRIMRINNSLADKLGCPQERLVGELCYKYICKADRPPSSCLHAIMLNDGKEHLSEDIVPLKNLELFESDNGSISESLSNRMAMLAGILTAVKEANIQ